MHAARGSVRLLLSGAVNHERMRRRHTLAGGQRDDPRSGLVPADAFGAGALGDAPAVYPDAPVSDLPGLDGPRRTWPHPGREFPADVADDRVPGVLPGFDPGPPDIRMTWTHGQYPGAPSPAQPQPQATRAPRLSAKRSA